MPPFYILHIYTFEYVTLHLRIYTKSITYIFTCPNTCKFLFFSGTEIFHMGEGVSLVSTERIVKVSKKNISTRTTLELLIGYYCV